MPKGSELSPAERERSYDSVALLTTTLEWPVTRLAEHLGYASTTSVYNLLNRKGSVGRARFEKIEKLVQACTLPSELVQEKETPLSLVPARPAEAKKRPGRQFESLLNTPIERRINQGIPIYVYLESARDQLGGVVMTFEDAEKYATNVLTAPGVERLRKRVEQLQSELDEALAMK